MKHRLTALEKRINVNPEYLRVFTTWDPEIAGKRSDIEFWSKDKVDKYIAEAEKTGINVSIVSIVPFGASKNIDPVYQAGPLQELSR